MMKPLKRMAAVMSRKPRALAATACRAMAPTARNTAMDTWCSSRAVTSWMKNLHCPHTGASAMVKCLHLAHHAWCSGQGHVLVIARSSSMRNAYSTFGLPR